MFLIPKIGPRKNINEKMKGHLIIFFITKLACNVSSKNIVLEALIWSLVVNSTLIHRVLWLWKAWCKWYVYKPNYHNLLILIAFFKFETWKLISENHLCALVRSVLFIYNWNISPVYFYFHFCWIYLE